MIGPLAWLYHGCRNRSENFFKDEASEVVQHFIAMSRVENKKQYVQDLLWRDRTLVYDIIVNRKAHIYLCGKVIIYLVYYTYTYTSTLF